MKTAIVLLAIVAGLVAIDRAALWAEARGWIYWRRRKRVGGQVGAAVAAELGAILSPAERTRQEVILRAEQLPAPDDPGGAPKPPGNA
ncbi:MAG TPA: hypothetical protein VJS45_05770 [Acidimicrobiia bacterium]|nr:hypothetical protein [Acidimicrobiia bacterium]